MKNHFRKVKKRQENKIAGETSSFDIVLHIQTSADIAVRPCYRTHAPVSTHTYNSLECRVYKRISTDVRFQQM